MIAAIQQNRILEYRYIDWSCDDFIPLKAFARSVPHDQYLEHHPKTKKEKKGKNVMDKLPNRFELCND